MRRGGEQLKARAGDREASLYGGLIRVRAVLFVVGGDDYVWGGVVAACGLAQEIAGGMGNSGP